ncbi:MAG: bifunctional (p)ppGpp synthetase/guanosine-3',5'-bis(diphosphate) 3'-pyrophosphohydrolase, partial [Myxococcales bacterium]
LKASEISATLAPHVTDEEPEPAPSLRQGALESLVRKVTGKDSPSVILGGATDILARYARCCNPLPGDEIVGFITRGRGITVHRRTCTKAFDNNDPERRVEVSWEPKTKVPRAIQVKVVTTDRPGILATLGQTFESKAVNVHSAVCRAGDDGRAINLFSFTCGDLSELKGVIGALRKVSGVLHVERV